MAADLQAQIQQIQAQNKQVADLLASAVRIISQGTSAYGDGLKSGAKKITNNADYFADTLSDAARSYKTASDQLTYEQSNEHHSRAAANRRLEKLFDSQTNILGKNNQHRLDDLKDTMRLQQEQLLTGKRHVEEMKKQLDQERQSLGEKRSAAKEAKKKLQQWDADPARAAMIASLKAASEPGMMGADAAKKQLDELNKERAAIASAAQDAAGAFGAHVRNMRQTNGEILKVNNTIGKTAADFEKNAKGIGSAKLFASIESKLNGIFEGLLMFAKGLAAKAFYDTIATARTEIKHQGTIGNISGADTAALGMSRPEYAQMMAEYRRTALAMGGLQATTDELGGAQKDLYKLTGDMKEATEVSMQMFDTMSKAGIKASNDKLKKFTNGLAELQARTGISVKQFADATKDLMEQEETQQALRMAASDAEREQIMMNTAERLKEYTAMGMSITQAKAAAAAMNQLAGKGPKERFKQGIKMQAMMGAMGVGGGEDVARIMRKPKNKWTKEDERTMANATAGLSNAMSERMGGDNLGAAMQTEAIGEKMGITEDSLKAFNTNAVKPLEKAINDNTDALKKENSRLDNWVTTLGAFDYLKSMVTNWPELAVGIAGLATVIGALGLGLTRYTSILSGVGGKLSGLAGKLGIGGATAGTGGAASAAGGKVADAAGGAMSSIGKGIKDIGKGAGNAIASIFGGLSNGLKALSNPRLFIGVGVLTALGGSLWVAGKALTAFTEIKWQDAATGIATVAGLAVVASALGGAAAPMLIGAGAIAALGGAMWIAGAAAQQFAKAFQMFAEVDWTSLGSGLEQFGLGLGAMVTAAPNPLSLGVLAASLGVFGLSLMPVAVSVALMDTDKLSSLTDNLNNMAEVDINKLNKVADVMERIANANSPSIGSTIASAATNMWNTITGQKAPDEGKEKKESKEGESNNPALDTIRMQLAAMNNTNKYLERVANGTDVMVELANKQLVAMTLTDKEKEKNRDKVRKGSGFSGAANYEYV